MKTISYYEIDPLTLLREIDFLYQEDGQNDFSIKIAIDNLTFTNIMDTIPTTEKGYFTGLALDYHTGKFDDAFPETYRINDLDLALNQLKSVYEHLEYIHDKNPCHDIIKLFKKAIEEDGNIYIAYDF